MDAEAAITHLRSPEMIRERCRMVYDAAQADRLEHFRLVPERLPANWLGEEIRAVPSAVDLLEHDVARRHPFAHVMVPEREVREAFPAATILRKHAAQTAELPNNAFEPTVDSLLEEDGRGKGTGAAAATSSRLVADVPTSESESVSTGADVRLDGVRCGRIDGAAPSGEVGGAGTLPAGLVGTFTRRLGRRDEDGLWSDDGGAGIGAAAGSSGMSSSRTLPLAAVTLTQPRSNSTRTVPSVSSVLSATMTSPFCHAHKG